MTWAGDGGGGGGGGDTQVILHRLLQSSRPITLPSPSPVISQQSTTPSTPVINPSPLSSVPSPLFLHRTIPCVALITRHSRHSASPRPPAIPKHRPTSLSSRWRAPIESLSRPIDSPSRPRRVTPTFESMSTDHSAAFGRLMGDVKATVAGGPFRWLTSASGRRVGATHGRRKRRVRAAEAALVAAIRSERRARVTVIPLVVGTVCYCSRPPDFPVLRPLRAWPVAAAAAAAAVARVHLIGGSIWRRRGDDEGFLVTADGSDRL